MRARCCCRLWFMSLVALVMVNRVYDWPGNSYVWLSRELGWSGADLAAQYAIWHAASFFVLFAAGVALDAVGGVPVLGTGAALLLLGSALLLVGHTAASLVPVRIIAALGYSCVELSANYLMAEVFGKRQGGLAACCRGGGRFSCGCGKGGVGGYSDRSCCGGGGSGSGGGGFSSSGGGGSDARSSGAADASSDCLHDFPQIAFAITLVQFFQRASMIPGLLMATLFFNAFGWLGVGYILIFGAVSLFASISVIIIYRGWLPCCALASWDAPLSKTADSDEAPLLAQEPSGDVVAAALDGAGTAPRQPLPPAVLPPGLDGAAAEASAAAFSTAPLPPPPAPTSRCSCTVPERFNFCQPELRSAAVILNGLVGVLGQVFYLVRKRALPVLVLSPSPLSFPSASSAVSVTADSPATPVPPAALC